MRTKALLLTAALGLAGAASSMAQVYSVNAVGYINVTCAPGFNLISDQLLQTNRTIGVLLAGVPDQTTVYKFTPGSGFSIVVNDLSGVGDWDGGAGAATTIDHGGGIFVLNPTQSPFTVTFVGEVAQGNLQNPIVAGFQIVSSKVPQAGLLQTDLLYPAVDQETVYKFVNPTGYQISVNDISGVGGWDPAEPSVGVGEALFINSPSAHPWDRTFTVN